MKYFHILKIQRSNFELLFPSTNENLCTAANVDFHWKIHIVYLFVGFMNISKIPFSIVQKKVKVK